MEKLAHRRIEVYAPEGVLFGDLHVPLHPRGLVIFAHGSGSNRHSTRNNQVARELEEAGLATFLVDLLTMEEDAADRLTCEHRFDIALLADRLAYVTQWALGEREVSALPVGYYGASTGAAAALVAAARLEGVVRAIVLRGGRPDLAGSSLQRVDAPSLFIVGERDREVLELNRRAARAMRVAPRLVTVAGAGHLFEEPGALDEVALLASEWFRDHLTLEEHAVAE